MVVTVAFEPEEARVVLTSVVVLGFVVVVGDEVFTDVVVVVDVVVEAGVVSLIIRVDSSEASSTTFMDLCSVQPDIPTQRMETTAAIERIDFT